MPTCIACSSVTVGEMHRLRLERWLTRIWYCGGSSPAWLIPLSWLYCAVVQVRRLARRGGLLQREHAGVPTLVVGNLTVGGTGKTPFVIALCGLLETCGWRVGIVTRGYGGTARDWPRAVGADSDPVENGDEAVLLAQATKCPVYAGADRVAAARALLARHPVDVLISDDGLQHEKLARDIEIVMVDARRGFGNGRCLPAGPLREPLSRLRHVDATVALEGHPAARFAVSVAAGDARKLNDPSCSRPLSGFAGKPCHAVTGIANPTGFFGLLRRKGLQPDTRIFEDHHRFVAEDIRFEDDFPVLMTAKDAVKCRNFAGNNVWYVPLELDVGPAFRQWLTETLKRKTHLG